MNMEQKVAAPPRWSTQRCERVGPAMIWRVVSIVKTHVTERTILKRSVIDMIAVKKVQF